MIKQYIKSILSKIVHHNNQIKDYHLLFLNCKLNNTIRRYMTSIGRYTKVVHSNIAKYCANSCDIIVNAIEHSYNHLTFSVFLYIPYVENFVKQRVKSNKQVIIRNRTSSVIMTSVTIGNGSVVGTGALVIKVVPDYTTVTGVFVEVIKYYFFKGIIKKLLKLECWNLDSNIIKNIFSYWKGI